MTLVGTLCPKGHTSQTRTISEDEQDQNERIWFMILELMNLVGPLCIFQQEASFTAALGLATNNE